MHLPGLAPGAAGRRAGSTRGRACGRFKDQKVTVTGRLADLLGAYRLNSTDGQNNIVVDVEKVRRADQIALEKAFEEAGWTGTLSAQITGSVELGTVAYSLVAEDIVLVEP